jgi:protein-tyrosine phosphatase
MPALLSDFIDIHTHILPGIDDGPKDVSDSIALARVYERAGITKVFATPHFLPGTAWSADKETVLQLICNLQAVLDAEQINLHIVPGMEIGFHKKMVEGVLSAQLLSLGNSSYFLIEPPLHGVLIDFYESLVYLLKQKIKLIIAHPERVEMFRQRPDLLEILVLSGARTQINTGSLLGHYGDVSKQLALDLWQNNQLHYIASDAHNYNKRAPLTLADWESIRNLPDGEHLLRCCSHNSGELGGQT